MKKLNWGCKILKQRAVYLTKEVEIPANQHIKMLVRGFSEVTGPIPF